MAAADLPEVRLNVGEFFYHAEPHLISTILGSCVAVCLWDVRLHLGGMTHSALPRGQGAGASARYTDAAIARLVLGLQDLGSRTADLQAKLFGGARVLPTDRGGTSIGEQNVAVALEELRRRRIPVVARQVHGRHGLMLRQNSGTGETWLRLVPSLPAPP